MATVSVLIPVYNRAGLIRETIESVLSQTHRDLEVIVVDDGSTDNTARVVKAIEDDRISYFHKTNGGVSSARNLGLSKVTGEYVAFLDSDDYWPRDFLERMLQGMSIDDRFGLAYASIKVRSSRSPSGWIYKKTPSCSGKITSRLFSQGKISPVAIVVKATPARSISFDEDLPSSEDSDYILRLSLIVEFLFVPDLYIHVNKSADSLSQANFANANRLKSLHRFYYELGGKEIIPFWVGRKKLAKSCLQAAKRNYSKGNYSEATHFMIQGIRYWPLRPYFFFFIVKLLFKRSTVCIGCG